MEASEGKHTCKFHSASALYICFFFAMLISSCVWWLQLLTLCNRQRAMSDMVNPPSKRARAGPDLKIILDDGNLEVHGIVLYLASVGLQTC